MPWCCEVCKIGIKRMESPPKQSSSWHSPHNSSNTDYADTVDDDLGMNKWPMVVFD